MHQKNNMGLPVIQKIPVMKRVSMSARQHWPNIVIVFITLSVITLLALHTKTHLVYEWRWERIPNYLFRWDETEQRWIANLLVEGLITTIRITLYASVVALLLGIILGLARTARPLLIRLFARTYLECLRNVPPIVIIFIFYFFLSEQVIAALELDQWAREIADQPDPWLWTLLFGDMRVFPALISGIIVLALFESAFIGEIIRAGIESIERGQHEAAHSLGLSRWDSLRFIILPQATKKVLPPLGNQFITLLKDSAIVSLISVQEVTYKTLELVASTRLIFEAWLTTAALFFVLCFGLSRLFRYLEGSSRQRSS